MSTTETTGRQGKCTAERPEVGTRTRRHACNALGWSDEPASTLRRGRYNFQRSGEGQRPSTTEHVQQCAETLLGVTGSSVPHSDRSTLNKLKDFKQVLRQRSPWLLLLECFFRKIPVGFRGRFFFPFFFCWGKQLAGTLLGWLGVVILALLTGGGFAVPGRVSPQCRRAVETVLILQSVRPIELRVLQPRNQTLVLVTKLPSHQSGLSHHHHILKGTASAGTHYPHNTGGGRNVWLHERSG